MLIVKEIHKYVLLYKPSQLRNFFILKSLKRRNERICPSVHCTVHFAFLHYQLHFFSFAVTFRTGRTPSLCSKTLEYARKHFSRAAGMDTCGPAGAVRQVREDRPTTEQRPGGLLRLSSHLDHPFQCARAHRCSRLQVCIGL